MINISGTEPVPYSEARGRSFQSSARFDEQQHPRRAVLPVSQSPSRCDPWCDQMVASVTRQYQVGPAKFCPLASLEAATATRAAASTRTAAAAARRSPRFGFSLCVIVDDEAKREVKEGKTQR